jgi:hypothetical protein
MFNVYEVNENIIFPEKTTGKAKPRVIFSESEGRSRFNEPVLIWKAQSVRPSCRTRVQRYDDHLGFSKFFGKKMK